MRKACGSTWHTIYQSVLLPPLPAVRSCRFPCSCAVRHKAHSQEWSQLASQIWLHAAFHDRCCPAKDAHSEKRYAQG